MVNQNSSTIFTNNNLTVNSDIKLTLWRNSAKATSAGITFNAHNSKTIACIGTNTFIGRKQSFFNITLELFRLFQQGFFFLFSLTNDIGKLTSFNLQVIFALIQSFLSCANLLVFQIQIVRKFFDTLFGKSNFQILKFNFF